MDFGSPPLAGALYFKGHGLGNDYLVVEEGERWTMTPESVRRVCHPHRGIGGDGIVLVEATEGDPFSLRMFNPDGSEFERSGNGLRVAAAHLARTGRVGSDPFRVHVGGGEVVMQVHGTDPRAGYDVSVEMGQVAFDPASVALESAHTDAGRSGQEEPGQEDSGQEEPGQEEPGLVHLDVGGETVVATHISVGNPHCVVLVDELSEAVLHRLGPGLTGHPAFGGGANVQFARPTGGGAMEILIWERGVGPTAASGTSACAVAAAAVRRGVYPPGVIVVEAPGGAMEVEVRPDWGVTLRAPVQEVATGELAPGLLALLD